MPIFVCTTIPYCICPPSCGWTHPTPNEQGRLYWSEEEFEMIDSTDSFSRMQRINTRAEIMGNDHCNRADGNIDTYQPYLKSPRASPEYWEMSQRRLALSVSQIGGVQVTII